MRRFLQIGSKISRAILAFTALILFVHCDSSEEKPKPLEAKGFGKQRRAMVETQIKNRGVTDRKVLAALEKVPREAFVPDDLRDLAYQDRPLPIGHEQTISQPYIVAFMTEALQVGPDSRVLEIGTGSGYQAAVLAEIVETVFTIEIVEPLGLRAKTVLDDLGYENVETRIGDGYGGWPKEAPFDAIIVTAAPEEIPQTLIDQLAIGGRMVIPVGPVGETQELQILEKEADGKVSRKSVMPVRFVPMTGGEEE